MLVLLRIILMNIENVHKVSFMDFILPDHVYYYKMFLISAKCFLLYILRN